VEVVNNSDFQDSINIIFKDKNLLQQAFIHASYLNENPDFAVADNERLEFLGDAVLNFICSELIYERYPDLSEGSLTEIRVILIREETLAKLASDLHLGNYLLLSKGEENSRGRDKKSNLADTFEALLGAIFLDQGLEVAKKFILPRLEPLLSAITPRQSIRNYKGRLQEYTQNIDSQLPVYRLIHSAGPDHDKTFAVEVFMGNNVLGRGFGKSKKAAEMDAARKACEKLDI
jgi:ribonuclease-3